MEYQTLYDDLLFTLIVFVVSVLLTVPRAIEGAIKEVCELWGK